MQPHYSHLPFPSNSYDMSILHGRVLEVSSLGWKKHQLKKWAEHSGCTDASQLLNVWVTYRVPYVISERKGSQLEASLYPKDWEWKLQQWLQKTKIPFICVRGGVNSSVIWILCISINVIFNITFKFHNYLCFFIFWIKDPTFWKLNCYRNNISVLKHMNYLN